MQDLERLRFTESTDPDFDPAFGPSLPFGQVPMTAKVTRATRFWERLERVLGGSNLDWSVPR